LLLQGYRLLLLARGHGGSNSDSVWGWIWHWAMLARAVKGVKVVVTWVKVVVTFTGYDFFPFGCWQVLFFSLV
jgi:hypothetical protein